MQARARVLLASQRPRSAQRTGLFRRAYYMRALPLLATRNAARLHATRAADKLRAGECRA